MMNRSERFSSLAFERKEPMSAHPGDGNDAQVSIPGGKTLHFLKEDEAFHLTLYYNPRAKGRAPAVSLGTIDADTVFQAVKSGVLVVAGEEYRLQNPRALRRIL